MQGGSCHLVKRRFRKRVGEGHLTQSWGVTSDPERGVPRGGTSNPENEMRKEENLAQGEFGHWWGEGKGCPIQVLGGAGHPSPPWQSRTDGKALVSDRGCWPGIGQDLRYEKKCLPLCSH